MDKANPKIEFHLKTTLDRYRARVKIVTIFLLIFFCSFLFIKFFSKKREDQTMMKITDYINREMDRILMYKTRDRQNEEFRNITTNLPIEPIRMTLTTAVFKYTNTNPNVILKRIIWNPSNLLNEDHMSMSLRAPNILKTLKTFRSRRILPDGKEQTLLWIFAEYLDVRISQKSVMGDENLIRKIIKDALQGLAYMHSNNVAHLDMKIGNIMGKTVNGSIVYKLIDFGYSQRMPKGVEHVVIPKKNYGTYPYKSPEIVFENKHGLKSDIWSLGAICWFLSLQYTPFYLENYVKDLDRYKKFLKQSNENGDTRGYHRFTFNKNTSTALKHFVKLCMQINPERRPTAEELLRHPFILGLDITYDEDNNSDEIDQTSFSSSSYSSKF